MTVFSFDVTVSTHGLLRRGVTEARMLNGQRHHRVVVEADTVGEAALIAGQMGMTVDVRELSGRPINGQEADEDGSVMCTGTYLRV